MSVTPIQYFDKFIDCSGQLWNLKDCEYVMNENLPPLREIILDHMALTIDGDTVHLDGGKLLPTGSMIILDVNNRVFSILVLINNTLISLSVPTTNNVVEVLTKNIHNASIISQDVDLLIPILNSNSHRRTIIMEEDVYRIIENGELVDIDQPNNAPKLEDIKSITNGIILTHSNEVFVISKRDEWTMIKYEVEFNVVDIVPYQDLMIALDDKGQLWEYDEEWLLIESRIVDNIGVRKLMVLLEDDDYANLYNKITFIGQDGYCYNLFLDDIIRVDEVDIPFELLNPVNNLKSKKAI